MSEKRVIVNFKNPEAEIIKMTYEEWINKAKKLFGKDSYNWKFKCPSCGHIQSINSMVEHNPSLNPEDIQNSVYFNCEGRINEGYGCDWTLGGLFQVHKVEVNFKGKIVPVFEFAVD